MKIGILRKGEAIRPLARGLVGYAVAGDEQIEVHEFSDTLIDRRCPFFEVGDDRDMVNVYPVARSLRNRIASIVGVSLRPDLDYFIEGSI